MMMRDFDFFYGIIGCGGHARSVADVILSNENRAHIIFFDDNAFLDEKILGFPVIKLSENESLLKNAKALFLGVGDNIKRKEAVERLKENGISLRSLKTLVSDKAELCIGSEISDCGAFIAKETHLGPLSRVGDFTIVNTGAIVEHECKVGSYSHISVNSTICGRCIIGNNVFIGAGAVIKDYVKVCDDVTIGAGAVVARDIQLPGTYVGIPARKMET